MNVFFKNRHYDDAWRIIQSDSPDILAIEEYQAPWKQALEARGIDKAYPYSVHRLGEMALYSRFPFADSQTVLLLQDKSLPPLPAGKQRLAEGVVIARVLVHHQWPLTVVVMHPKTPVTPTGVRLQAQVFDWFAAQWQHWPKPAMIIGDSNTTVWSTAYGKLQRRTGFEDSMRGYGVQPTWPSILPLAWIPIDQCWLSSGISVLSRETVTAGWLPGSDHVPLRLTLSLAPSK